MDTTLAHAKRTPHVPPRPHARTRAIAPWHASSQGPFTCQGHHLRPLLEVAFARISCFRIAVSMMQLNRTRAPLRGVYVILMKESHH